MRKNKKRTDMLMNNQPKFLAIALLAASIFILGLNIYPAGAQNAAGEKKLVAELSDDERAWLAKHPSIKQGFNPDLPPLLIQDANGINSGILPDIFAQLEVLTHPRTARGRRVRGNERCQVSGFRRQKSDDRRQMERMEDETACLPSVFRPLFTDT